MTPVPAMPPRPKRPLSTLGMIRLGLKNSLALFDEEMFDAPIVERRYAWGRFFSVSDPEGVRRVSQDNLDNYPRIGPVRRMFAFGSGTGMLAAEGEPWRRHRRTLNPLLDHRSALADLPIVTDIAERLADLIGNPPVGKAINIGDVLTHLITAASGRIFAEDEREIDNALYRLGQYPGRYSILDFVPPPRWLGFFPHRNRDRPSLREIGKLIDRLVATRRDPNYAGRRDLLWRIVQAADPQTGDRLSDDEIRDEVMTLGATAATPIRVFPWLFYLLALHPDAEQQVHAELARVLGGRTPTAADYPHLVYLRRVVDETLRLYPPAPVVLRTPVVDDVICGRRVPRNSIVLTSPWIIHRHRALWDEPDRFDPGRFEAEQVAARSRYSYVPFGIGPRICIGASLALVEIVVTAAILAQKYRFRLDPEKVVEPIAWTNLHPRNGMYMTVEPRE